MENRTVPSGLLEREVVTFRNLTLVVHTIRVDGAGSTVRHDGTWGLGVLGSSAYWSKVGTMAFLCDFHTFMMWNILEGAPGVVHEAGILPLWQIDKSDDTEKFRCI